jgi:hypothetical protein
MLSSAHVACCPRATWSVLETNAVLPILYRQDRNQEGVVPQLPHFSGRV